MEVEMKTNLFLLLSLMIMSCSSRSGNGVLEIDSHDVDKHVLEVVKQYIKDNPDFSSYIIDTKIDNKGDYGNALFTISHYDSSLFGNGEGSYPLHPSISFKVEGKTVYVISNMDFLLRDVSQDGNTEKRKASVAWLHYYNDAVMYYIGRGKKVRIETLRPDTIFIRKSVHFEAPPIK
ncbi:MAG: hypothetical protein K2H16_03995 [Prevotella sp.]|nr:hypothetical protein [Prevotella sp.]